MLRSIIVRGLAIASMLVATACQSATGIVATYRKHGTTTLTVEVDEKGYGRLDESGPGLDPSQSYGLVMPGGRTLTVMSRKRLLGASAGEGWVVMDATDYSAWLARGSPPPPPAGEQGPFREAGEARVGQWSGTRYVLTVRPHGWVEIKELVVLRRPDLEPLGRLLGENSLNAWKTYGIEPPAFQREMARLMARGAPLRVGDNFTLTALDRRKVDLARLRPPSPPLSRAELFRLLDARPKPPPGRPVAADPRR